ncbi:MAG: hypothetical protein WC915_03680 [archaeon]|jgi:hypothetical protein
MKDKELFMGLGVAGTGILIGIVLIVVIVGISFITNGDVFNICKEQSRQELNTCNIDCGEGVLSGFCKSECTSEHNARLEQCTSN